MRRLRVALIPAGLALGTGAEWLASPSGGLDAAISDLVTGWVLLGCGLVAWDRRPTSLFGPLLVIAGVAWFVGSVVPAALYLHRGPLVHALLTFPGGRLSRRSAQLAVAAAYVDGAIEPLGASPIATLLLCAVVTAAAVDGYVGELGPRRRARAVATAGAVALALVLGFGAVARLAGWDVETETLWVYEVTLTAVALGLLADLLRGRWSQGAVTGLVIELGELPEQSTLRDRLARALGDSSLELGWWIGSERGYVDEAGRLFALPQPGTERAVTPVESEAGRVAVLVHDRAVLDDPALVDAVAAAARIGVENVRLQAEVRVGMEQLASSRRRIVEAADAERRRLERELHDGAEQRLAAVSAHVEALAREVDGDARPRALVVDVETQLGVARSELRELAHGIHPVALTTGGLAAAIPELARRASVPVRLDVEAPRLRPAVEAAAYFVCAEALTNVAKYARASRAAVDVHRQDGRLVVEIADDGVGGADPSGGSGLRGLADRVEALGGQLRVESSPERGTRIVAEIPAE